MAGVHWGQGALGRCSLVRTWLARLGWKPSITAAHMIIVCNTGWETQSWPHTATCHPAAAAAAAAAAGAAAAAAAVVTACSVFVPGGQPGTAAAAAAAAASEDDSDTDADEIMEPADTAAAAAAAAAAAGDASEPDDDSDEEAGQQQQQGVVPFELTDIEVEVRLLPGSSSSSSGPTQVRDVLCGAGVGCEVPTRGA